MPVSNTLQGDYSSMYGLDDYKLTGDMATDADAVGRNALADLQSNWFGEFLLGTAEKDRRDWHRSEQSADNALVRDMIKLNEQNAFAHNEAELSYERERELRQTAYQDTMADMKAAGLNPIMAYSQGATSTSAPATASSGSGNASSGHSVKSSQGQLSAVGNIIGGVLKLVNGLYGTAADAVAGAANRASRSRDVDATNASRERIADTNFNAALLRYKASQNKKKR